MSRRRGGRARRSAAVTLVGVLLLTVGLGSLGWVGYQFVGTTLSARQAYISETEQVRTTWAVDRGRPKRGESQELRSDVLGLLRVPRFGPAYEVPILSGTDPETLSRGVGHYPGTAGFGAVGNAAIAGHRITHGQPFARLLELDRGDRVVVETREAVYTYALTRAPREVTVSDAETWVLRPTADRTGKRATRRLLTLTTCTDLFRSPDRSVGVAELVTTDRKR